MAVFQNVTDVSEGKHAKPDGERTRASAPRLPDWRARASPTLSMPWRREAGGGRRWTGCEGEGRNCSQDGGSAQEARLLRRAGPLTIPGYAPRFHASNHKTVYDK
jgi:hypothetical protein